MTPICYLMRALVRVAACCSAKESSGGALERGGNPWAPPGADQSLEQPSGRSAVAAYSPVTACALETVLPNWGREDARQ
jgi:hypothetical protein